MHRQIISLTKALSVAGLLSISLAACVSGSQPNTSSAPVSSAPLSSAPVSSEPVSSVMSSVAVSSSSSVMSVSSVPASSVNAISSSSVSSSSAATTDCSDVDVSAGEDFYTGGPINCTQCHGTYNGMVFPGPVQAIEPNDLKETTHAQLAQYLEAKMAAGFNMACTDAACRNRAVEMAKYINKYSSDTNWCNTDTDMSSSSAPTGDGELVDLYAINAGGKAITLQDGTEFTADFYSNAGNTDALTDLFNIEGVAQQDLDLYRTERWGEFTYDFPVKDGSYDVKLYIMEGWFGPQNAGNRVFDVTAEGQSIASNVDPLAQRGHDKPFVVEAKDIQVTDGKLSLDFTASVDAASIRAIVVRGLEGNKAPYEADPGTVGTAAVPSDCSGDSEVTANDFVLFDGSQVGEVSGKTLGLHGHWVLQEVWDANAKLETENTASGKAIAYSNASIFTGFKFAPPADMSGEASAFKFSGADIYIDYETNRAAGNLPTFGFRVNYEGEANPNGPGGASTAKWMVDNNNQEPYSTNAKGCSLITLKAPLNWDWDAPGNMGNKLIWEMKNGWSNSDKIRIRRIVFKDFEYKM
ncbi:malectin domain-containing carbohydrate-binding protein [Marinagarivorans algicola]|uniref:malectin domain-containing carbohydrate-binding protein n=1 Tax=Marinagarivorans algicola TaxID=1513270 RepID=UPI0037355D4C